MPESELLTQLEELKIQEFFTFLVDHGWIQILFPFLLTYAIVFSVSNSISFMSERRGVRILVSVIISFFAVTFPVGTDTECNSPLKKSETEFKNPMFKVNGCTLGDYMSLLFPGVTIFSMMILGIYIIAQLLGVDLAKMFGNTNNKSKIVPFILIGIGALMILYFTIQTLGLIPNTNSEGENSLWAILSDPLLWTLVVFGVIFYFIGRDPDEPDSGGNTGGTPPAAANDGGSK